MKEHEEAKSLRQAVSQYATLLQHQIEQNLRSRLLVDSHSTLEARRMLQQPQGFPYSLGEDRAKVANYVTAQMAKQDIQKNEDILQKFRMEAILFRNNKIRSHPRGNSLPMVTESMLHGGNIADLALQILLPKSGNALSRLEGLTRVQTSELNDPKRIQLAPVIPPAAMIKVKQKRRRRLKPVDELGKIEGILKDIHVNLIRNSMILREIKDRPHSRNVLVSQQSQTVDTMPKNNPKRFKTLTSQERSDSQTEASNHRRPRVEYIHSADNMEYTRMCDGLKLLKSNRKRARKDVTGAS